MQYKFTIEELYFSYEADVINCLINNHNLGATDSINKVIEFNLRHKFINNLEDFEFVEPSKVARVIIESM